MRSPTSAGHGSAGRTEPDQPAEAGSGEPGDPGGADPTDPPTPTGPVTPTGPTDPADSEPAPVQRLGRTSMALRAGLLVAGTLLVFWGTLFGNDVDWPFGPMSQYAFRIGPDDTIHSTFLEARTADGQVMQVPITVRQLGIARAQIEGQQPAFIREPDLLSTLAAGYDRLHPTLPRLTQLWLGDDVTKLHDGRDAGHYVTTLVGWPINDTAPELPR